MPVGSIFSNSRDMIDLVFFLSFVNLYADDRYHVDQNSNFKKRCWDE
jgi:hypothetical protein